MLCTRCCAGSLLTTHESRASLCMCDLKSPLHVNILNKDCIQQILEVKRHCACNCSSMTSWMEVVPGTFAQATHQFEVRFCGWGCQATTWFRPEDAETRAMFIRWVITYPRAVMCHVRVENDLAWEVKARTLPSFRRHPFVSISAVRVQSMCPFANFAAVSAGRTSMTCEYLSINNPPWTPSGGPVNASLPPPRSFLLSRKHHSLPTGGGKKKKREMKGRYYILPREFTRSRSRPASYQFQGCNFTLLLKPGARFLSHPAVEPVFKIAFRTY